MKETNGPTPVVPPALDNERADMMAKIRQQRSVLDESMELECTGLFSAHASATQSRVASQRTSHVWRCSATHNN